MISSLHALRMAQSDFGIAIITVLQQDVLRHKVQMLVVCSLCVLYLLMKLFLVVGLMAVSEHIVWTIVNYFGKLKMLIKVASLQSV